MSDLPKGWTSTTLGDICSKPQYGWTSKASRQGKIKYLRTTDISDGKIDWESVPFCELEPDSVEKYQIQKNDILVSRAGSVGISYRIEEIPYETVFASYLIRFNPLDCALPQYVEYFLKSHDYWTSISESSAGIAIPNVNATKLAEIKMPLAPLNEQKRIVEKLEKLLGKAEAVQARLDKIPAILKRFRQAVLAAACSGQLLGKSNKNVPDSTIKDVTKKLITGPFGSSLHKADYIYGGTPVINPMSMIDGKIVPSEKMSINEKTKTRLSKYLMKKGEIVIARRGELGRCAEITGQEEGWLCGTGSALLSLKDNALPTFIQMIISSPISRAYLSEQSVGTTMENLNQKLFLEMPIYLPPLEEQKEIVRRVEDLFQFADRIEARYKRARSYTDKLTQSILAKAFRGELVPQDERDESASLLLERIKAEKADNSSDKNQKPKKKAANQSNLFE